MNVNKSLRNLQLSELNLFKEFTKVCEKEELTYFALGGTLLGAVRHKGFIPWDDDMDLGMPRPDYERFLKLCDDNNYHFELHTYKNDKSHMQCFAKIEDPNIKVRVNTKTAKVATETSAWIDIFPLDGMPNNVVLRTIWKYYLLYRRAMYKFSCFDIEVDVSKKNRPIIEKILIKIGKVIPISKILNPKKEITKIDKAMKRFEYDKCNYLVNAMGAWKFKEMFHKKYYGEGKYYKFEDTKVFGPVDYNTICTQLYGDYMTPPKEEDKNHHSSEII